MRVIIVGCGRVGAGLAESLARADHDVTILDINTDAFNRLESDFPGQAVRGDGTDEDVLRRAGADGADAFFSLTEGDNRNILTAQLAAETLGIPRVVAKINDPVRAQAYRDLGLATICRTTLLVDALAQFLGMPADPGVTGVSTATGHHPGGGHHGSGRDAPVPAVAGADADAGANVADAEDAGSGGGGPPGGGASGGGAPGGPSAGSATTGAVDPQGATAAKDGEGRTRRSWKLLRRSDDRGGED